MLIDPADTACQLLIGISHIMLLVSGNTVLCLISLLLRVGLCPGKALVLRQLLIAAYPFQSLQLLTLVCQSLVMIPGIDCRKIQYQLLEISFEFRSCDTVIGRFRFLIQSDNGRLGCGRCARFTCHSSADPLDLTIFCPVLRRLHPSK